MHVGVFLLLFVRYLETMCVLNRSLGEKLCLCRQVNKIPRESRYIRCGSDGERQVSNGNKRVTRKRMWSTSAFYPPTLDLRMDHWISGHKYSRGKMKENEELTDRKFNWRDGSVEKVPPAWGERLASNVSPPWPAWSSAWLAFFVFPLAKIKIFWPIFSTTKEKKDDLSLSLSVDSSSFLKWMQICLVSFKSDDQSENCWTLFFHFFFLSFSRRRCETHLDKK